MATIVKEVHASLDLTSFTVSGEVGTQEIITAVKDFYESAYTLHVLWDFTDALVVQFKADDIRLILSTIKQYKPQRQSGRTALVVNSDLSYGLGRMYQILAEVVRHNVDTRVMRHIDEAYAWIGEPLE